MIEGSEKTYEDKGQVPRPEGSAYLPLDFFDQAPTSDSSELYHWIEKNIYSEVLDEVTKRLDHTDRSEPPQTSGEKHYLTELLHAWKKEAITVATLLDQYAFQLYFLYEELQNGDERKIEKRKQRVVAMKAICQRLNLHSEMNILEELFWRAAAIKTPELKAIILNASDEDS